MLDEEAAGEENVGWPSYVDFLSTFAFILLLFIGSTVYLISDVERQQKIHKRMTELGSRLAAKGYRPSLEGTMLRVPLSGKVEFAPLHKTLTDLARRNLRDASPDIANYAGVQKVVIQGYADKDPVRNNPFGNWDLSVGRATAVLQFLYECSDCGYNRDKLRPKLALRGEGDTDADKTRKLDSDRRVDILVYFK